MSGWLKLHRQLQDNPLWTSEPFSRGQAWVDLMMLANHKGSFIYVRGNRIDVGRGVVARSKIRLAENWKWSRGKVLRFLTELEKDGQIVQETVHGFALITLCNYEEYQAGEESSSTTDGTTDSTTDDTTDGHETVQQTVHIQEEKQEKECKEGKEIQGKPKSRNRDVFRPPSWIPKNEWAGYVAARRSMKKHPMSAGALELCVKAIEKCVDAGHGVVPVLEAMTENGWRTVKPAWMENINPTGDLDNAELAAQVNAEMGWGVENAG